VILFVNAQSEKKKRSNRSSRVMKSLGRKELHVRQQACGKKDQSPSREHGEECREGKECLLLELSRNSKGGKKKRGKRDRRHKEEKKKARYLARSGEMEIQSQGRLRKKEKKNANEIVCPARGGGKKKKEKTALARVIEDRKRGEKERNKKRPITRAASSVGEK